MDPLFDELLSQPYEQRSLDGIEAEFNELYNFGDIDAQTDFADAIDAMLSQFGTEMQRKDPELWDVYQSFSVMLRFRAFSGFSPQDQTDLIQRKLFYAIQKGFEVSQIMKDFRFYYEDPKTIEERSKDLAKAIEQNMEKLGTVPLEVEGNKYIPQLKYWVLDYSKFPSATSKRSTLERLNYINKSMNVRQLPQIQRQQLLEVLKLYDQFLNPENVMEFRTDQQPPESKIISEAEIVPPTIAALQQMQHRPAPVSQTKSQIALPKSLPSRPFNIDIHEKQIPTSAPLYELEIPAPASAQTPASAPVPAPAQTPLVPQRPASAYQAPETDTAKEILERIRVGGMHRNAIDLSNSAKPRPASSLTPPTFHVAGQNVPAAEPAPNNYAGFLKPSSIAAAEEKRTRDNAAQAAAIASSGKPLPKFKTAQDFAMLDAEMLHHEDPYRVLQQVLNAMVVVAKNDSFLTIIRSLDDSPLQQSYVQYGINILSPVDQSAQMATQSNSLNQAEFEAYTDFRRELDQSLI